MPPASPDRRPWWESAVVYQVYPRSFQDSNADGIGDLPGITNRLPYLVELGVDTVWLSPIMRSPMADFGYDIADYRDVDPIFGSLADLDALVTRAHELGLRVLLDLVPSHTSSEHPWFVESRSSRSNPKRDWYLWSGPRPDGSPPTNWLSMFGGSGWEWDEATGQFYFHAFLKEQPDLNWRNPEVRAAMYDVMRFWLARGIDGFRVDVLWLLIKDAELRDNPPNPAWTPAQRRTYDSLLPVYTSDRPEVHDIIAEMRGVLDEFGERVLIGEIYLPLERLVTYYGTSPHRSAHLPFNFQLLQVPWDARRVAEGIGAYEALLPGTGWPNWVLGNHDNPRIATRIGAAQARVAAMLLLTLRGIPTIYYGDEIGMVDVAIPEELQQDPARFEGPTRGRDPERTPMRWDASEGGGFTSGRPWLPVGPRTPGDSVEEQRGVAGSMLELHRRLLALRGREPAITHGAYRQLAVSDAVLAYERVLGDRRFGVVLNLTSEPVTLDLPALARARVSVATHLDREGSTVDARISLRADEGLLLEVG